MSTSRSPGSGKERRGTRSGSTARSGPRARKAPSAKAKADAAPPPAVPLPEEALAPAPAPAPAPPAPEVAPSRTPDDAEDDGRHERLHKFLASTGAGSRRECETFIAQGRVTINGKVVTRMGVKVDPFSDVVSLDGERVRPEERVYYLLHKPTGYICTNADERGRPRAMDLVKETRRIYTVGRLDADSTGLVILTNDGEIANVICHPRYRIHKRYQVHVRGEITRAQIARVEAGVWLAEGKSSPARVHPIGRSVRREETLLEMTVFEGRNREIRRVLARVGLTVRRLQRISIGPLELGELPPGAYRRLRLADLAFVEEARRMYQANKEAWDAELPPEPPRHREGGPRFRGGPRKRRFGPRKEGKDARRPRKDWGGRSLPERGHRRPAGEGGPPAGPPAGGSGPDRPGRGWEHRRRRMP